MPSVAGLRTLLRRVTERVEAYRTAVAETTPYLEIYSTYIHRCH